MFVQALTAAALLTLAPNTPTAAPDWPDLPDWTGCWVQAGDAGYALLLEPERCGWLQGGQTKYYRLAADGGSLRLESWGRLTRLDVHVEDDRLHVVHDGTTRVLERVETPPDELLMAPYPLPSAVALEPDFVEELQAEFRFLHEEDQRVRVAARSAGFDEKTREEMMEVDRRLTGRLFDLVTEIGWIDATRFGPKTAGTAFLIVQHSGDLRLMRAALPFIEEDVRAGRLDGQNYALLFDRLQLNLGYPQRYGSQLGTLESGESALMPCEDPEKVDELRASLGMGPLSQYLALFEATGKEVRTLEEVLEEKNAGR